MTNSRPFQRLKEKNLVAPLQRMETGSLSAPVTRQLLALAPLARYMYLNELESDGFCGKPYFTRLQPRSKHSDVLYLCGRIILWLAHGDAMGMRAKPLYLRAHRMAGGDQRLILFCKPAIHNPQSPRSLDGMSRSTLAQSVRA